MEKKTVRCTFYGLRSIYDVDLRDQMHDAVKKVVEEQDMVIVMLISSLVEVELSVLFHVITVLS